MNFKIDILKATQDIKHIDVTFYGDGDIFIINNLNSLAIWFQGKEKRIYIDDYDNVENKSEMINSDEMFVILKEWAK